MLRAPLADTHACIPVVVLLLVLRSDLLLNGWGSDCLVEDASVLVLAESVEAPLARAPHAPRRMDGFTFRRVSLYDVKVSQRERG